MHALTCSCNLFVLLTKINSPCNAAHGESQLFEWVTVMSDKFQTVLLRKNILILRAGVEWLPL